MLAYAGVAHSISGIQKAMAHAVVLIMLACFVRECSLGHGAPETTAIRNC